MNDRKTEPARVAQEQQLFEQYGLIEGYDSMVRSELYHGGYFGTYNECEAWVAAVVSLRREQLTTE